MRRTTTLYYGEAGAEAFGHGGLEQVVFEVGDTQGDYPPKETASNVHGYMTVYRDGAGGFRTLVVVRRRVPHAMKYRDYMYVNKLIALHHELGHVADLEGRVNFRPEERELDVFEAEVCRQPALLPGVGGAEPDGAVRHARFCVQKVRRAGGGDAAGDLPGGVRAEAGVRPGGLAGVSRRRPRPRRRSGCSGRRAGRPWLEEADGLLSRLLRPGLRHHRFLGDDLEQPALVDPAVLRHHHRHPAGVGRLAQGVGPGRVVRRAEPPGRQPQPVRPRKLVPPVGHAQGQQGGDAYFVLPEQPGGDRPGVG